MPAHRNRIADSAAAALALFAGCTGAALGQDAVAPPKLVVDNSSASQVPQTGRHADALNALLARIQLPPGFKITLFAIVPGARHLAVAPSGNPVFAGTRKNVVWSITDQDSNGVAEEVRRFAHGRGFQLPNGVCFDRRGDLIVAELNRVTRFMAVESSYRDAEVKAVELIGQDQLVPPAEASPGHGARTCRVAADGKLYITLGQPFNVQPKHKIELYEKLGIGGVIRVDAETGARREVFARGLRNPVGIDIDRDGMVWTTDNQTDGMGDDSPPGKLSKHPKSGAHYGYPWVIGTTKIPDSVAGYELSKLPMPKDITPPVFELPAHAADLGLVQYNADQFPARYRGAFFIAEHGSWDRSQPIGARVMVATLNADGSADRLEPFAHGWIDERTGQYLGRPVDVAVAKDGSLLVSDDAAGAIYRISYTAP